jgi:hypothetical protein
LIELIKGLREIAWMTHQFNDIRFVNGEGVIELVEYVGGGEILAHLVDA